MNTMLSVKPVALSNGLQVRISAPLTGTGLPVIVFSHGFGQSLDGYAPLADFWATHGFVVVQPTHLDSRTLNVPPDDPRTPLIWRLRRDDLITVLDELDPIEDAVPGLAGRLDRDRIAMAGHSWGAQTVGMLLGARVVGVDEEFSDPRVKAGVLLAAAGRGGADLAPFAAEHFAFMNPDFTTMTTPALIVAGDQDQSQLSVRGPDWFTDAYHHATGPKSLLTVAGGEHSLGGITGYATTETTDESPERVALIQRMSVAYLNSALGIDDSAWQVAQKEDLGPLGHLESF
ncbi:hypothetical protein [Actinoplanes sp. N902-109]|uniref:alpha/beta hydrolase family protein n=1 Tax=Actinoplanes sp. (strain N902-109) TaxID=649831 RepID=UPI0003294EDF|nr:hypothetical protein [Actinoplanes sp. N902-109]AGL14287.1 hypothetical protein L083_0777 [Actinoplanes sp. N902-109]